MRDRWMNFPVVCRALTWVSVMGFGWGLAPTYALTELEEEHLLSTSFATPHTKWAQPYARGKLRVLFFMNIGYCNTVPREVVELKQRFDLDAEAVFWANIIDSPKYHWHGDAAGLARMKQLVAQPWDCFVFFDFPVEQVPVEEQYNLILAVTKGAGLVLVGTDDQRVLKPERQIKELPPFLASGVPLAALPFVAGSVVTSVSTSMTAAATSSVTDSVLKDVPVAERTDAVAAARMVTTYRVRDGRGVRLPARPNLSGDDPTWQTQYEYWQSLFGRAIIWAANREPNVGLTIRVSKPSLDWAELPAAAVTVHWQNAAQVKKLKLDAVLRRLDGQQTPLLVPPAVGADGIVTLTVPRLRAGQYFVDVRASGKAGGEAWATAAFQVTSPLRVAAVKLNQAFSEIGGSLSGTANLVGLSAAGQASVRVNVCDPKGRMIARQELPAAESVPFRFAVEPWLPMLVRVEACVLVGGQEVSAASAFFNVTQRHRGQFNFLVWDMPHGTLGPYGEESLKRLGMTLHLGGGTPPQYVTANDVAWVPYTTHVGQACQPACWNDEKGVAEYVDKIVAPYTAARQSGVFVYSLGDEIITRGACTQPTCLAAYRKYLELEYKTIGALNASWGASYTRFDDVQLSAPDDNQEAEGRRLKNYPRWYDRQAFQSYNFTRLCKRFVDGFAKTDPQARVGFEGAGTFEAGDDYDLIVRTNGFWSPYPGLGDEIIRSIAPRDFPRANWMGYTKDADTLLSKYWRMITRGCDSVWWWRWDGVSTFHGLLAPHLGPYKATEEMVKDTQVVRDGLGTLLLRSEMLDDGIAILYSMPSAYACQVEAGPSHGRYAPAHEAWSRLIREVGLQYRYVTDRMLRLGEFQASRYKVLVLPRMEALGAAEAEVIRRFAENGGTVIADVRPGLYDGHCKPVTKGVLDDLFGVERTALSEALSDKAIISAAPGGGPLSLEWDKAGYDAGIHVTDGQALGRCGAAPLVIVKKVGKGQAVLLNFAVTTFPALGSDAAPAAASDFVRQLFASAGVRPVIEVRSGNGQRAANLEIVRWRNGTTDMVALFREAGQREEVTVTLSQPKHVYDLRQRRYLKREASIRTDILPCRATFFALTPERVAPPDVKLSARTATRGDVVKATLSCPGAGGTRSVLVRAWMPGKAEAEALHQVVMVDPAGGANVCLPIAYNDPPGRWQVSATELFTNKETTERLNVK